MTLSSRIKYYLYIVIIPLLCAMLFETTYAQQQIQSDSEKELCTLCSSKILDTAKIQHLLDAAVDINTVTRNNLTPLHLLIQNNHTQMAKHFIENGAIVDPHLCGIVPQHVPTPLKYAVRYNNYEMVQFLFERGASFEGQANLYREACNVKPPVNYDLVKLLLNKRQEDPKCRDDAVYYFSSPTYEGKGADSYIVSNSPYGTAMFRNDTQLLDILVSHFLEESPISSEVSFKRHCLYALAYFKKDALLVYEKNGMNINEIIEGHSAMDMMFTLENPELYPFIDFLASRTQKLNQTKIGVDILASSAIYGFPKAFKKVVEASEDFDPNMNLHFRTSAVVPLIALTLISNDTEILTFLEEKGRLLTDEDVFWVANQLSLASLKLLKSRNFDFSQLMPTRKTDFTKFKITTLAHLNYIDSELEFILQNGANPNSLDGDNLPPLQTFFRGQYEYEGYFDRNIYRSKQTWQHFQYHDESINRLRILLAHGADPNHQATDGLTPMMAYVQRVEKLSPSDVEYTKIIAPKIYKLFLDNGLDTSIRNHDFNTLQMMIDALPSTHREAFLPNPRTILDELE